MVERKAGKRGMLSFRREAVKFRFDSYILLDKLPALPKTFGHVSNRPPWGAWNMFGNDKYGDCVMAGAAHEEMHWAHSTQKSMPRFTDDVIIRQYLRLAGGADVGLDPVAAASHRRNYGITDADGRVYKIKAYALIDSLIELAYSSYLFDAAAVGMFLPKSSEKRFVAHQPWDDVSEDPDPQGGHYVPIIGKSSAGLWVCVTWGQLQGISDAFLEKYCFGAGAGGLAYFSKNYLLASGKSPEAFDEAQLDADLATIPNLPKGG
jgi:hypothetical protein